MKTGAVPIGRAAASAGPHGLPDHRADDDASVAATGPLPLQGQGRQGRRPRRHPVDPQRDGQVLPPLRRRHPRSHHHQKGQNVGC